MGYIISHPNTLLGIERRWESIRIYQQEPADDSGEVKQVYTYGGTSVEMTKTFLGTLLAFFDNPHNRKLCDLNVGPALENGE